VLRAIDEGYGHLVGVALLQFWVTVDIKYRVRLAGLGTHGSDLCNRHITQMAALSG
jgi:hypothetical protein